MSVHQPHVRTEVHAQMVSLPTHVPVQPATRETTVKTVSNSATNSKDFYMGLTHLFGAIQLYFLKPHCVKIFFAV